MSTVYEYMRKPYWSKRGTILTCSNIRIVSILQVRSSSNFADLTNLNYSFERDTLFSFQYSGSTDNIR
jgi:hypothetical protein